MASVIQIVCPKCENPIKVPESVFGKTIKCKQCEHPFVVREPNEGDEKSAVKPILCPNCERSIKVPESVFGKKIKCKHCDHPFVVRDPDEDEKPAVKPTKPGGAGIKAKKEEPKQEEPKKEEPQPANTYKFADDDDDEGAKPKPLGVIDEGQEIPRCPHCAMELDPPDAVVCTNCGFNNVTRVRAETKKVWEPDTSDWMNHLGPGIIAAVLVFVVLIIDIVCCVNMKDWMKDTILMKDDKGPDGDVAFYVKPGAFMAFIIAASIPVYLKAGRFAVKRLIYENKPTERVKL
jgi:uncharacterized CHY-type Zn-finger protein